MNDPEESDSEWDSTLDFTSPRPMADKLSVPPEIEDEDASHQDSMVERPKPKERTTIPANQKAEDATYAEVKKENRKQTPQKMTKENSPPYNFREAVSGNITPQKNDPPPPGRDRKGTTYDVTSRVPVSQQDSILSTGSWDDTDEDEKTLRELRETFKTEKKKEQEAVELRIRLESQGEEKLDEGQMTNRSETTWKSWASFGSKSNKGKKKKKEGKTVPTYRDEGHYDAVDITQVRAGVERQENTPGNMFQTQPNKEVKDQGPVPDKAHDTSFTDFRPAYMSPPFVVKEETGMTYYFGHGSVQYLEVDNDEEEAMMPKLADRLEGLFHRIWQEFFGALRIVTSFFILFLVELFKYIIKYVFQPIFVGIFVTAGDYIVKPVLSVLFNGCMQPTGVFFWNCCVTTKLVCTPMIEILRKILEQFAMCCRFVRCVEIYWKTGEGKPTMEVPEMKHV
ncbi:uncharacterized protein LOC130047078 [Ostrea edulis]|uniref:uncharacterized protein LOC130047078 n=1 Tax=Ostrea edulis TaxID=37623 RepID=UPI0024AF402D|nr:uncharacterized protein LOC130047078 [Ostrea edulis]XP_055997284.1 uncharacterized protein LOC130047078 [Ostrea edulis]